MISVRDDPAYTPESGPTKRELYKKDLNDMKKCTDQGQKDSAARKDSSVAVSLQDKEYLENYALEKKFGSTKDALADVLAAHRAGVKAA